MALRTRNGGSQTPDYWLKLARNTHDFCNGAGLQISHEGIVVKLLERLMRDNAGNISYFIYELDYGKTYQEGCISDQSGNIDFSTPEKLYDYLMA